jgi:hypothetical protein
MTPAADAPAVGVMGAEKYGGAAYVPSFLHRVSPAT